MTDYQPISCADHERLEFAALRRVPVSLLLRDGRRVTGQVLDVFTREGAEWLRLREAFGAEHLIRLDTILHIAEPAPQHPPESV